MNNSSLFLARQLVFLFLGLFFLSCSRGKKENNQVKAVPVQVQQIEYDGNAYPQEYIGTVESENAVDVSFLVIGNIEQMYVSEGQHVSKGQLLARLNTTTFRNSHEAAVATLRQAQDAYKRLSAMYQSKSLPEIQFIDVKTKLEQAKASEAIARKSLQDCNLYASQSGVIGTRYLEPGANVMTGTPVYKIMNIHTIKVKTAIPEGDISHIHDGVQCQVQISALNNESFVGRVVEKGVSANPISHTYDIMIRVNNPGDRIMPGMVCKVYLSPSGPQGAGNIVVPIKSVQVDFSGKRFVWLKDKDNKAVYREVVLGPLSENGVEITSGLQPGDQLITAGYQNISVGTKVSVNQK